MSRSDDRLHGCKICLGVPKNFGQYLSGMICILCLEEFVDEPRKGRKVRLGRDGPGVIAKGQDTDCMECQDCRACRET